MSIRICLAAVLVASLSACTPPPQQNRPAVTEKTYAVTPASLTVKAGLLSGELTEMKVVERVEEGSGRVDQPAKFTCKLILTTVSKDQTLHVVGGKVLYIDMAGKPIPLEDKRTEPMLKVSSSYNQERLDPGQNSSQPVEAEFPAEALKMKRLKEIRLELLYIPSAYRQETMNFGVSISAATP